MGFKSYKKSTDPLLSRDYTRPSNVVISSDPAGDKTQDVEKKE